MGPAKDEKAIEEIKDELHTSKMSHKYSKHVILGKKSGINMY